MNHLGIGPISGLVVASILTLYYLLMTPKSFIKHLKAYRGENIFNPYHDVCPVYDRFNADLIRRKNLQGVLEYVTEQELDSLWIGRDLGYKGGRRTGLALTDEAHFERAEVKWNIHLTQATKGPLCSERTAVNIWNFLDQISENVFMWNVFPFHPHEANKPMTNRSHTARERDQGIVYLKQLVELIQPKKLVAIGNDAFKVASDNFPTMETHKIRHPSYGGQKDFSDQIISLYGLKA